MQWLWIHQSYVHANWPIGPPDINKDIHFCYVLCIVKYQKQLFEVLKSPWSFYNDSLALYFVSFTWNFSFLASFVLLWQLLAWLEGLKGRAGHFNVTFYLSLVLSFHPPDEPLCPGYHLKLPRQVQLVISMYYAEWLYIIIKWSSFVSLNIWKLSNNWNRNIKEPLEKKFSSSKNWKL